MCPIVSLSSFKIWFSFINEKFDDYYLACLFIYTSFIRQKQQQTQKQQKKKQSMCK